MSSSEDEHGGKEKMVEPQSGESQDKLLQRIEQGFRDMQEQLQKSDKANSSLFVFSFGFTVVAAGLAVGLAFQSIKDQFGIPLLLVLIIMLTIGGVAIMKRSGGMTIIEATYNKSQANLVSTRVKAARCLLYSGGAIVFSGIAIRQWFAMPGNAVGVFGFFVFIVAILMMPYLHKKGGGECLRH